MSLRELPARPSLEHLKNQARTLLQQGLAADTAANEQFVRFGIPSAGNPKLADALHVIAREYGFDSWPALKLHVEVTSAEPFEALGTAIKANNPLLVRGLLTRYASLKSQIDEPLPNYAFDMPAIVAAVHAENREIVDALLEAGANLNERTRWWAGSFGVLDFASHKLAEYLISRGAAIDIHAACRLGRMERIRELLRVNPSLVHARGCDGQLPLHLAATVEIAAFLLDCGAEINALDDHESTAAQYMACCRSGLDSRTVFRHDVARFLISRGAQTDILMASAVGDLSLVERILNHDPETVRITVSERHFPKLDPKSGGNIYVYGFGLTKSPHMIAHQFGHHSVFELLMQRSPPWLRLTQAAEIGDQSLVRHILQQHDSLFARLSPNAARRIVGAAVRNNTHAVALLLDSGWPPHATLDNQQTALHYAAWHGNLTMVKSLLRHEAPINILETEHGGSPLGWALHGSLNSGERSNGDYPGVTRTLLGAGATIPKPDCPLEASEEVLEMIREYTP